MGTRAVTRIQHNKDGAVVYTRYDGYTDAIKNTIKSLSSDYQQAINYLRKNCLVKTPILTGWLDALDLLLQQHQNTPTIENTIALLCMGDFNHHQPMYLNEHDVDLFATISSNSKNGWHFRSGTIKPKHQDIDSSYYIVRVYDGEPDHTNIPYIDCKIKRTLSWDTLIADIVELPLFWRDFLALTNLPSYQLATSEQRELLGQHLFKIQMQLKQLYCTHHDYHSIMQMGMSMPSNFEAQREYLINHATSMIPMALYSGSFISHLMLQHPGHVTVVTSNEHHSGYTPDHILYVDTQRLNNIWIPLEQESLWDASHYTHSHLNRLNDLEDGYFHLNHLDHLCESSLNTVEKRNRYYMTVPYVMNTIQALMSYQQVEYQQVMTPIVLK